MITLTDLSVCACGHLAETHDEGHCALRLCGCLAVRKPDRRHKPGSVWDLHDTLKAAAEGVTVEVLDDDLLRVWLDDCTDQDAARKLLGAHIPKGSSADHLAYVGSGIVRVTWNAALIGDYRVIFTDVNDLNEVIHRVADITGLTDAELGEYVYDDTGADL